MRVIRNILGAVAVATLAVAGAGAGTASAEVSAEATTAGCGKTPPASGNRTITVSGQSRQYILDVPSGYDRNEPTQLVFALHGLGGDGAQYKSYAGLGRTMGGESILVYPSANTSNKAWDMAPDALFFDAMVSQLSGLLCVDTAGIFATGHSMGGIFSNYLGCARGDVLRAIAPIAGANPNGTATCRGDVAVLVTHGNPDPIVPFEAGVASRDYWMAQNGCSRRTYGLEPGVEYVGCKAGHGVRWYEHTSGHFFPNYIPTEIAEFFDSRK